MTLIRNNWFWPLMICLWAMVWTVANRMVAAVPSNWEYALLFDVFVTAPFLYWLCYRSRLTHKALLIRMIAIQCLGIWIATKVMPLEQQRILPELGVLRAAGLIVMCFIELRLMVAVVKVVFRKEATQQDLVEQGAPELIGKLMILEARFWRWVLGLLKR